MFAILLAELLSTRVLNAEENGCFVSLGEILVGKYVTKAFT